MYGKVTEDIVAKLKTIVGSEYVFTDEDTLKNFSHDETEDFEFLPEVVVMPSEPPHISEILKLASNLRIPVTPRGAGTGLSGGALPIYGGIILSMKRFNKIIEIDERNFQVIVEPGVITQVLQEEVEKKGMFYPPDPASRGSSFIGGNLAECSGGPRAVKYGVTKDYVLGVEAVLPTGETINTGGRVIKNVTGYNLTQLLIGSEGTLAVITKIILRLIPLPRMRKVLLAAFPSLEDATDATAAIFQAGVIPSAIEFMEKSAIRAAEEKQGRKFPNSEYEAHLLIEVDGNREENINSEIETIAEVLERFNVSDAVLAEDEGKVQEVWALRRGIGEAVKSISAYKEEDTVVPRARMTELVKGVKEISSKFGITSICYGHAGDGNIHVNILKKGLDDKSWQENLDKAIREIFELTVRLGGTISGEHGIGYSQKNYLNIAMGESEINLMRKIKQTFDPYNILNPGKIFPDK